LGIKELSGRLRQYVKVTGVVCASTAGAPTLQSVRATSSPKRIEVGITQSLTKTQLYLTFYSTQIGQRETGIQLHDFGQVLNYS
jgi:hypothetical protein